MNSMMPMRSALSFEYVRRRIDRLRQTDSALDNDTEGSKGERAALCREEFSQ